MIKCTELPNILRNLFKKFWVFHATGYLVDIEINLTYYDWSETV